MKKYNKYLLSVGLALPNAPLDCVLPNVMELRESDDMLHWSDPVQVPYGDKSFGNHYVALVADDAMGVPNVAQGDSFSILSNHNGTDVARFLAEIRKYGD